MAHERLCERQPRFFEREHRGVVGGKVEESPVFELVEQRHDPLARELEAEQVRVVAFGEQAGLEEERRAIVLFDGREDGRQTRGLGGVLLADDVSGDSADLGRDGDLVLTEHVRLGCGPIGRGTRAVKYCKAEHRSGRPPGLQMPPCGPYPIRRVGAGCLPTISGSEPLHQRTRWETCKACFNPT